MNPEDQARGSEPPTLAEERLLILLSLLQADPPRSGVSLTESVMRTARWQYVLRGSLRLLADLTGAIADGLALAFGSGGRDPPRERR